MSWRDASPTLGRKGKRLGCRVPLACLELMARPESLASRTVAQSDAAIYGSTAVPTQPGR